MAMPLRPGSCFLRDTEMKPLARKSRPVDEVAGLEQALDKSYSRLRERARAAWERHHAGKDPSDACISVRITPPADAISAHRVPPRLRITTPRQPRRKVRHRCREAIQPSLRIAAAIETSRHGSGEKLRRQARSECFRLPAMRPAAILFAPFQSKTVRPRRARLFRRRT